MVKRRNALEETTYGLCEQNGKRLLTIAMILLLRFLLVFSTFLGLVGARNCRGFLQTHMQDGVLGKDFFLDGICFRSMRVLIPVTYIRITVTFKDREAKKPKLDRWTVPLYRQLLSTTRVKHLQFVRVIPANTKNHTMAINKRTHYTKGTSSTQISGNAHLETIKQKTGFVRKKRRPFGCDIETGCPEPSKSPKKTSRNNTTNHTLSTSTLIADVEATTQAENETLKPDSGAAVTTTHGAVGVFLMSLITILYVF